MKIVVVVFVLNVLFVLFRVWAGGRPDTRRRRTDFVLR